MSAASTPHVAASGLGVAHEFERVAHGDQTGALDGVAHELVLSSVIIPFSPGGHVDTRVSVISVQRGGRDGTEVAALIGIAAPVQVLPVVFHADHSGSGQLGVPPVHVEERSCWITPD